MFAARIGRIRMKSGGADIRVLDRKATHPEGENWQGKMVENAKAIADMSTDQQPLAGYLTLGIFADGSTAMGFRYDMDNCAIPRALLPSWVAEVLRRDLLTAPEAERMFDDKFQWVE